LRRNQLPADFVAPSYPTDAFGQGTIADAIVKATAAYCRTSAATRRQAGKSQILPNGTLRQSRDHLQPISPPSLQNDYGSDQLVQGTLWTFGHLRKLFSVIAISWRFGLLNIHGVAKLAIIRSIAHRLGTDELRVSGHVDSRRLGGPSRA
jgi:hypothetical protein